MTVFSMKIEPEVRERLESVGTDHGVGASTLARKILEHYLQLPAERLDEILTECRQVEKLLQDVGEMKMKKMKILDDVRAI